MNVLILSAGTRNKIVRYFKSDIGGKVIATDMSATAPAIYEADKYYLVPRISDPGYIDCIMDICRLEQIDGIVSLIDPELSLITSRSDKFEAIGVKYLGSSYELCDLSFNKMKLYRWMAEHGYHFPKSYDSLDDFERAYGEGEIDFPVITKPICGSASMSINEVKDIEELRFIWERNQGILIQERLIGREIGVDCYIDMITGEVVSVFSKYKLRMRAGETDKSLSFKDPALFELVERFAVECGFRGQIDIDVFDVNGVYYVNEVNPRFGGGYPHAHECGCNHIKLIRNNLEGVANEKVIGEYDEGVCMMKYVDVMVRRNDV